jgi:uncharacterized membrane-anchored protein YitT (DUF2179 family)
VFTKIQHYTDIKAVNFIIMLLGIIIFSFGTGLYSAADFGRGSYEAVTFSLAEKNGWKIKIVRMVLDILMVVIGVLLGGKFGICTVATVLLSGPVIQATVNTVKKAKIFKSTLRGLYYVKKKEQVLRQETKAASSARLSWRRWQFTDYLQKTRDQRQKAAAEPDKVV